MRCSKRDYMQDTGFRKQLRNIFSQVLIIPITIQFADNRFKTIDIKLCSLTEMTGKPENTCSRVPQYYLYRTRQHGCSIKKKTSGNNNITTRHGNKTCEKQ